MLSKEVRPILMRIFHTIKAALAGTIDGEHFLPTRLLVGAGSGGAAQGSKAAGIDGEYYWL